MNKQELLYELETKLSSLSVEDIQKSSDFYSEAIDDRIEDGMSEEEAVADLGAIDEIVSQILNDIPLPKLVKEKVKPKRALKAWEIVLLALGSPVWIPILVSLAVVALCLYLALWAVVAVIYVGDTCAAALAIGFSVCAAVNFSAGDINPALFYMGLAICCVGLAVILFFAGCKAAKITALIAKKITLKIKEKIAKKEKLK